MDIVDRIKELCKHRKITLAELERQLAFGNSTIRKWNEKSPSSERLQKVADYFNVSTDYLLGRVIPSLDNEEQDIKIIQRAANDMTPEQRKKALNLWKAAFDELFEEDK